VNLFYLYFNFNLKLDCTFKPEINKKSEEIDKRNKLAFLLNLNRSDLNLDDFLFKPESKLKINNLPLENLNLVN